MNQTVNHTPKEIRAFRYWIQGYPNFYEPIVAEYFAVSGYRVERRPAQVTRYDIQRVSDDLFDGIKQLGGEVDSQKLRERLDKRSRLQPDLLLSKDGRYYLAELKSWGGFGKGVFDLATLRSEFLKQPLRSAYLLLDWIEACGPIGGKFLVASSRSAEHDVVLTLLRQAFTCNVELLYLDEILRAPQLAGFIEHQLHYLDAAVAELKQAFRQETS
jgi:hypothetical protein